MAITPTQFLARLRNELDDVPDSDYTDSALWTDAELYQYITQAQQLLIEHVGYLRDRITLHAKADRQYTTLPDEVIDVEELWLRTAQRTLNIRNYNEMTGFMVDDYGLRLAGQWRGSTGTPDNAVLDLETGRVYLIPTPVADEEIDAVVLKTSGTVDSTTQCFELKRETHVLALLPKCKELAYSKHDADSYDPQLALKYKAESLVEFDRVYDSLERVRKSNRAGSGTTRYGGIPW